MKMAARINRLGTESAFDVLTKAQELERQGRDVVHLEIGEPDFDTATHIKEAAASALAKGETHYGPAAGIWPLREAIAVHAGRRRGVRLHPDQVVVTPGAKPIIFFSVLALVEPGDEVLVPDPGFPIYASVVEFVNGRAVPLPLREQAGFRFDPDELRARITPRTRMLILNSPQNPTGGVLTRGDMEAVASIAQDHRLWVLSDEIYGGLIYEGEHVSILSFPELAERTILVDGFSKFYAMTGWRLGYGVVPRPLAPVLARLQTNCTSCTATFVQWAGLAALEGPQDGPAAMLEEFRRRRAVAVERLTRIEGVRCQPPAGAFYAFPRVEAPGLTSQQIADALLAEYGVALLPGTAFGGGGEGFLRLSFATAIDRLEEGIRRMGDGLAAMRAPEGRGGAQPPPHPRPQR